MRWGWVVHNNSTSMAHLIVEGLKELGREDIEHITSREDILGLRDPLFSKRHQVQGIGEFPDYKRFVPKLATKNFWKRLRSCDFIIFIINGGKNHNAYRAAALIRRYNLFHKVIYLDEDERGELHSDFRDMFLKSHLAFVAHRPRLYQKFKVHPHVVFLGFNGVETRYLKFIPPAMSSKKTSVFYRGRLGPQTFHRKPFVEKLRERNYPNAKISPSVSENIHYEDLKWQFITGNRHNVSYYQQLADAKIAVYLNGWNPLGYQFWECAALKCAQVIQSPKPNKWYPGGSYAAERPDWEYYEPPFESNRHYLVFESPDEMLDKIEYFLSHDDVRQTVAEECHALALKHYTAQARAKKFLEHLFRKP